MVDVNEKEIQKTLEEINKRAEEFQSGKIYSPNTFSSFLSTPNLKLVFAIVGVVCALILLGFFVIKPVSKPDSKSKASPQNAIKYQQEQL